MILAFNIVILSLALVSAIIALQIKDNLSAAIIFGTYSFLMCFAWTVMGAVDVAFTEATVGAGVSTVFFIATIFRTLRRTSD
eukprot:COSAG05_NODE_154_length_15733_cov_2.293015_11_plen_82_part_00